MIAQGLKGQPGRTCPLTVAPQTVLPGPWDWGPSGVGLRGGDGASGDTGTGWHGAVSTDERFKSAVMAPPNSGLS